MQFCVCILEHHVYIHVDRETLKNALLNHPVESVRLVELKQTDHSHADTSCWSCLDSRKYHFWREHGEHNSWRKRDLTVRIFYMKSFVIRPPTSSWVSKSDNLVWYHLLLSSIQSVLLRLSHWLGYQLRSSIMTDPSKKSEVVNFGAGPAKLPYEVSRKLSLRFSSTFPRNFFYFFLRFVSVRRIIDPSFVLRLFVKNASHINLGNNFS